MSVNMIINQAFLFSVCGNKLIPVVFPGNNPYKIDFRLSKRLFVAKGYLSHNSDLVTIYYSDVCTEAMNQLQEKISKYSTKGNLCISDLNGLKFCYLSV